ncbi:hypothetical protein RND71_008548 [Anisodus tanguticus]|uniref:Uncharacterized protein n=1 Tax=Anisodus tanguticus TaxID=243964 RepID=A0AAE1VTV9_9SOLA|nr:hypothetical protein RND71_008548 [Anisodus tanguticus]
MDMGENMELGFGWCGPTIGGLFCFVGFDLFWRRKRFIAFAIALLGTLVSPREHGKIDTCISSVIRVFSQGVDNFAAVEHFYKGPNMVDILLGYGKLDRHSSPKNDQIYPHGSTDTPPYATMGSGSLAAMAIFESKYREGLSKDEGIKLVAEAILSGVFNDLGSGSNVDICVITKGHTEYFRNHMSPNPRTYPQKGYSFPKKSAWTLLMWLVELCLQKFSYKDYTIERNGRGDGRWRCYGRVILQ